MRLRSQRRPVEIRFPRQLPCGGCGRILQSCDLDHLHCSFSIDWWHIEEFGRAPTSRTRALHAYARVHGLGFVINGQLEIEACFLVDGLTFFRPGGAIVSIGP